MIFAHTTPNYSIDSENADTRSLVNKELHKYLCVQKQKV